MTMYEMSIEQVDARINAMAALLLEHREIRLYGVPTGGMYVERLLMRCLRYLGVNFLVAAAASEATVFIDDIIASGATREKYLKLSPVGTLFLALCDTNEKIFEGKFVRFPWESSLGGIEDNILRVLQYIGEDTKRDGLKDTPKRVIKSWDTLFGGYNENPEKILERCFDNDGSYDQMIILRDIDFQSTCEHHMLPFFGKVHVAYIPAEVGKGKIVGISKLARLVDCFSKRLQVQERLTNQIAQAIMKYLGARGAAVLVEGTHMCMVSRGVRKQNSIMVTSSLLGELREQEVRMEFLLLKK